MSISYITTTLKLLLKLRCARYRLVLKKKRYIVLSATDLQFDLLFLHHFFFIKTVSSLWGLTCDRYRHHGLIELVLHYRQPRQRTASRIGTQARFLERT